MRISYRTLLAFAAGALFSLGANAQQFINVLTGGTSGIYYPLGVSLTQIYGKAIPTAKATVQSTKASAENLNLLQAGRGEIALTLGDALSLAWKGDADAGFKTPLNKLRGVSATYSNYIQIVASADSGIKTMRPGSPTAILPRSNTCLSASRWNSSRIASSTSPCSPPAWAWPRSATWPPR